MSVVIRLLIILSAVMFYGCGSGNDGGNASSQASVASANFSSVSISPANISSANASSFNTSSASAFSVSNSATSISKSSSPSSSPGSGGLEIPSDFPSGTVDALPELSITTDGGVPIISREDYVAGQFSLNGTGGEAVSGTLEIRGRGNSTWGWPKKPYRLKLTNSISLGGMPASKHWVLLANYADKTLMRNDITFMFSKSVGMEYTPRAQYVEVKLNGEYQGVYQLVEHIRVAKDRVNIPEIKVADTDAENISGGYLMEIDFRNHKNFCVGNTFESFCVNGENLSRKETFCLDSNYGMEPFCLQSPETLLLPEWSAQRDYITKYFADTETALFGENFADPAVGYAAYLDTDSIVNYYIINELFKNVDGMSASAFVYKKRNEKLFFGPVWDFDLSMGNAGYNGVDETAGWHIRKAPWMVQLFKDPAFEAKVKARWQALKAEGKFELLFIYARARATWLDTQQKKNYSIWSVTDVAAWVRHGTHGGTGSYGAEVDELIRWQRERYQWMDAELSK
ncbi:MAG TPA: CotH kinase family protein [Cellvibrio sp.]|nr:CotH kinase family protein [Cellvibrio sp.]